MPTSDVGRFWLGVGLQEALSFLMKNKFDNCFSGKLTDLKFIYKASIEIKEFLH